MKILFKEKKCCSRQYQELFAIFTIRPAERMQNNFASVSWVSRSIREHPERGLVGCYNGSFDNSPLYFGTISLHSTYHCLNQACARLLNGPRAIPMIHCSQENPLAHACESFIGGGGFKNSFPWGLLSATTSPALPCFILKTTVA